MKYYDTTLTFIGAILLSDDEANTLLTKEERKYKDHWWLRTPGLGSSHVCYVYDEGNVSRYGINVSYVSGIRPALIISNLGDFKVGDIISIGKYYFKIIEPQMAWLYKQDIGTYHFDVKSNNYETSHVKQVVDTWFEKLKKEMK